jgi:hypothetical protein
MLIKVRQITWRGPDQPNTSWIETMRVPPDTPKSALENLVGDVLKSPKYFAVCSECATRNPLGWMHDERICQSCAERNRGVIY